MYAVIKNSEGKEIDSNIVTSDDGYAYFEFPESAIHTEQTTVESQKELYLQELDAIDKGLADFDYLYEDKNNANMLEAAKETYDRWEEILNEIYGLLEMQLSNDDMESLKAEQLEWIEDKEKAEENEASDYDDADSKEITKNEVGAQYTKERCYELVNKYME